MGSNNRYGDRGLQRGVDEILVRAQPVSLTEAELDFEHHPVHRPAEPAQVRAWIRFHEATIRPECEAIAWTDKTVQVRWRSAGGVTRTAWVWASAVDRGWDRPTVPPRR